jgi:hypothetical protein
MDVFTEYLAGIENLQHQTRVEEILLWVSKQFPDFIPRMAWNQPMFTDHGTFIIAFSVAKHHLAVAPEQACLDHFSEEIQKAGYEYSKMLMRIQWNQPVDYSLLEKMIRFNVADKAGSTTFWRK